MYKLLLVGAVLGVAWAAPPPGGIVHPVGINIRPLGDCPNPNGTDTNYNWYSCNPTAVLQVNTLDITDDAGNPNYPIDINKVIVLHTTSTLTGSTTYNSMLEDVDLNQWGGPLGCSWHSVPTFGLLDNIDQCGNCPLAPGALVLDYTIDLTPFAPIISSLVDGGVYSFDVHMKNGDDSAHEEIGCLTFQGKVKTS